MPKLWAHRFDIDKFGFDSQKNTLGSNDYFWSARVDIHWYRFDVLEIFPPPLPSGLILKCSCMLANLIEFIHISIYMFASVVFNHTLGYAFVFYLFTRLTGATHRYNHVMRTTI